MKPPPPWCPVRVTPTKDLRAHCSDASLASPSVSVPSSCRLLKVAPGRVQSRLAHTQPVHCTVWESNPQCANGVPASHRWGRAKSHLRAAMSTSE